MASIHLRIQASISKEDIFKVRTTYTRFILVPNRRVRRVLHMPPRCWDSNQVFRGAALQRGGDQRDFQIGFSPLDGNLIIDIQNTNNQYDHPKYLQRKYCKGWHLCLGSGQSKGRLWSFQGAGKLISYIPSSSVIWELQGEEEEEEAGRAACHECTRGKEDKRPEAQ